MRIPLVAVASALATKATLLERLVSDMARAVHAPALSRYLMTLAQLGGYLATANDPPPDNKVIWRRMHCLIDIELGYQMAREEWVITRTRR